MTIKIEFPSDRKDLALAFGQALCKIGGESTTDNTLPEIESSEGHTRIYTGVGVSHEVPTDSIADAHKQLAADGANLGPYYWLHQESESFGVADTLDELEKLQESDPLVECVGKEIYDDAVSKWSVKPPIVVQNEGTESPKSQPATGAGAQVGSGDAPVADAELDIKGMPWDERIHSKNKSKNKDGSWRNCRMPKNFDGNQPAWNAYIQQCEAEYVAAPSDVPPPSTENDGADVFSGPVTTDVPPPVVDAVEPPASEYPQVTFGELMKLVTTNMKNGSAQKLDQVLNEMGIAKPAGQQSALPIVKTDYPDRIGEVYAKLSEVL